MQQMQRVITSLLFLFVVAGLLTMIVPDLGPTGAAVTESVVKSDLFCYQSYFCQSGIECMYTDEKKPFCTQSAALDGTIGQKHGEPCFITQDNQVKCPLVKKK